ncbi:MAG: hypothetical protein HXY41_17375 [Chloroflexi bacterium]|nr:hypothetical protein [Chloroflexota bacterium]
MLTLPFILSAVSAATSGIFAALVLRRWWQKRAQRHPAPHLLAWGIGLLTYFVGTLAQVVLSLVWSPLFFALWYWCGALMTAAWLGQGTVYLLVRRGNIARNLQMALILVGVMTLPWTLLLTPFNESAWRPGADMTEIYRDHPDENGVVQPGIMAGDSRGTVRFFSPIMNLWGTIALVGGAIYSSILFQRKQILRDRMAGNWLIALGGLMPALGGALIRLGDPSFKYVGEMLGAIIIFAGFLLATREVEDRTRRPAPQAAD